ncbi:hypothetical protein ABW636_06950 [Aquimarina sp. 2201CG1-2-11]|uniref:hypothetical protein n=1 Tax=Aquimarina discodermiae TaxID=3231043 RepID=UPI0034628C33
MEEIIYRDRLQNVITEAQASQLEEYDKYYLENNEVVRFEKFSKHPRRRGGGYYLKPDENVQDYIDQYVTPIGIWMFYYNKQTNAYGHTAWDFILYHDNVIKGKRKECYTAQNELLAMIDLNIETEEPKFGVKYYYNPDYYLPELLPELISFSYKPNSKYEPISIRINNSKLGDPDKVYTPEEYQTMPKVMAVLPLDQSSYYHDILPVLPTNPIT